MLFLEAEGDSAPPKRLRSWAFGLFVFTLAVAPFPLGGNRPWSWSLISLLIAGSWLLWTLSVWSMPQKVAGLARGVFPAILLAGLALLWGLAQMAPVMPQDLAHPVLGKLIGGGSAGTVSIAPWRTGTELMKLGTYGMAAWLAYALSRRSKSASRLLNWLIAIGAFYALYGFALGLIGRSQFALFYGMRATRDLHDFSGPFVNRNSYATYAGLISLCAAARLAGAAWEIAETHSGFVKTSLAALQYVFGHGAWWLAGALLSLSAVIVTGSRGGNLATFLALAAMAGIAATVVLRRMPPLYAIAYGGILAAAIGGLFSINGARLLSHLNDLPAADLRFVLWDAAQRMIGDAPLTGLGLGTYQAAYPLYAHLTVPFVIDKAHNDYLELAAGWGLPAALCWWAALLWLSGLCVRGIFARQRNRIYPLLALGAVILVGVHAIFDFSLQMPAIALTFAAILGLGVAQAFPTRKDQPSAGAAP